MAAISTSLASPLNAWQNRGDHLWLTPRDALAEARRVAQVVQGWQNHFAARGVPEAALEELAQHIDRPFLKNQRQSL